MVLLEIICIEYGLSVANLGFTEAVIETGLIWDIWVLTTNVSCWEFQML